VKTPLLRNRQFRAFLAAITVVRFCSSGMTVLLGFQIYDLTRSPLYLGLLGLVEAAPGVTLVLYGGDVADRHSRRRIIILTTASLATLAATLALTSAGSGASTLAAIYVAAFLSAVVRSFQSPAATALEAQVLPLRDVMHGIPVLAAATRAAEVAGPAAAGLCWAATGAVTTYATIAVLFALASLVIASGVAEKPLPKVHATRTWTATWQHIAEGVRYVFASQFLVGSMALDLFAVFFAGANALLPAIATGILHVGPQGLGLLRSASAAGSLAAALLTTRLLPRRRAGVTLHAVIALFGFAIIAVGLSRDFYLTLASLFFAGLCDGVSVVIRQAILRLASPEALRGRIAAVKSVFVGSSNELGAFQTGFTASLLGADWALCAGGTVTLIVVATVARYAPLLLRLDLDAMAAAGPVTAEAPGKAGPAGSKG
jgi:predicted MFS family arabinose efflux permease